MAKQIPSSRPASKPANFRIHPGIFMALGRQNMPAHRAICELVDDAIAASEMCHQDAFHIDICLKDNEDGTLHVDIIDTSGGIASLDEFLDMGHPQLSGHRLNEHGIGWKHGVSSLTDGGNHNWELATRHEKHATTLTGPFGNVTQTPECKHTFYGTIVSVDTPKGYFAETLQGGVPSRHATSLAKLAEVLAEHLGVIYREYLLDDQTHDKSGDIQIMWSNKRMKVKPIYPTIVRNGGRISVPIEVSGDIFDVEYHEGTMDPKRSKGKYYYSGGQRNSGVEITIVKRLIATGKFNEIFDENFKTYMKDIPHPDFRHYWGHIIIPAVGRNGTQLPLGSFRTTPNKSDIDRTDPKWSELFEKIRATVEPIREESRLGEKKIRNEVFSTLYGSKSSDESVEREQVVYGGVKVDVLKLRRGTDRIVTHAWIHETKDRRLQPIDVMQARMYWDGLVRMLGYTPNNLVAYITSPFKPETDDSFSLWLSIVNDNTDEHDRKYKMEFKSTDDYPSLRRTPDSEADSED